MVPVQVQILRIDGATQTNFSGTTDSNYVATLRGKVKLIQMKLWQTRKALEEARRDRDRYKLQLDESKNSCQCHLLPDHQVEFIKSQVKAATVPKKGMRWTFADKTQAISLYLKSPAAYKQQASQWRLPHKNTLLKVVRPLFRHVLKDSIFSQLFTFGRIGAVDGD